MNRINTRFENQITYIELNDPESRNSFCIEMAEELLQSISAAETTDSKIIVISSNLRAVFSVGPNPTDLLELHNRKDGIVELAKIIDTMNNVILCLSNSDKLTIAAVHGMAYGGGLNFILPCNYRLVAQNAKFYESFNVMGLPTDLGASYYLPTTIGKTKAEELILSGRLFTASEAVDMGMFHKLFVKKKDMLYFITELANAIDVDQIKAFKYSQALFTKVNQISLVEQMELEKKKLMDAFCNKGIKKKLEKLNNRTIL